MRRKLRLNTEQLNKLFKFRFIIAFFLAALFITAVAAFYLHIKQIEQQNLMLRPTIEAQRIGNMIIKDLEQRTASLNRLTNRWIRNKGLNKEEFISQAENYIHDFPGVSGMAWINEKRILKWLTPLKGNEKALDLDMTFEAKRNKAMTEAFITKKPVLTEPLQLITGEQAIQIYNPIFNVNEFQGYIVSVFILQDWIFNIIKSEPVINNYFALTIKMNDQLVYTTNTPKKITKLEGNFKTEYKNHTFSTKILPLPKYISKEKKATPAIIFSSGISVALLLVLIFLLWLQALISKQNVSTINEQLQTEINKKEQTESQLHYLARIEKALTRIAVKFINANHTNFDSTVTETMQTLGSILDIDRIYLFEYNFNNKTTSNTHEWCREGIVPQISNLQNISLEAIPEWVETHKQNRPMVIQNVDNITNNHLKTILQEQSIKSLLTVPISVANELKGFIGFDSVKKSHYFTESELNLLTIFSEIITNTEEKENKEKELKTNKERLDLALKGTNAGLWDWNIQTGETFFNERWAEIIGYTLEELQPIDINTWINYTHPKDLNESEKMLNEHFKGKTDYYEIEVRMKHKNGSWVWILDRGRVVEWDSNGEPLRMAGTHVDITEKKVAEQKLQHLATHDILTDLPSFNIAKDRIEMAMKIADRKKMISAVMFIDLDGFKQVNDTYGHETGNILLQKTAKRISSEIRRTDTVARIGGDEFLAVFPEIQERENIETIAEIISNSLIKSFIINNKTINISCSIGIAVYPEDAKTTKDLIRKADKAMYKIKKSGKNGWAFY